MFHHYFCRSKRQTQEAFVADFVGSEIQKRCYFAHRLHVAHSGIAKGLEGGTCCSFIGR